MRRVILGLFALVVLAILFVTLCTFVREPYEIVLLNRFGRIINCTDGPNNQHSPILYNWYLKLPTDQVVRIDTRLHLQQTPLEQAVTAGSEPLSIQTFVAWRIVDPDKFYKTTAASDEKCKAIIERKVSSLVQAKVAAHSLEELFNTDESKVRMAAMEQEIAREATVGTLIPVHAGSGEGVATAPAAAPTSHPAQAEWMPGVEQEGIQIVQVGFSRMAFPPSNAQAVYDRMAAEREKQAQDFETQGKAQKELLTEDGQAKAAQIRGEAVAKAEQIRGQADKEANAILAGVQQSQAARDFYQYWKSLDFVKGAFTKNTYIVLPTDSDWLSALFNAPKNIGKLPVPAAASARTPQLPAPDQLTHPIDPTSK